MSEPDVLTTAEHVRNAKHLYTTAIHAMKAYYAFQKKPTPANEKEMHRQIRPHAHSAMRKIASA